MFSNSFQIKIEKTLKLEHCWVCGCREALQEHHIVPQAFGGKDSPLVTLCATHHDQLHLMSFKDSGEWLFEGNQIQKAKMQYLTTIAQKAMKITKSLKPERDINKTIRLSPEEQKKLKRIKKAYNINSDEKMFKFLLNQTYNLLVINKNS